jgi:hypothetical protein
MSLVAQIQVAIASRDHTLLSTLLAAFPLEQLPSHSRDKVLAAFIIQTLNLKDVLSLSIILESFDVKLVQAELPQLAALALNPYLTDTHLTEVLRTLEYVDHVSIFIALINCTKDDLAHAAAVRWTNIITPIKPLTSDQWQQLYMLTEDVDEEFHYENEKLRDFLREQFQTNYTPIWVHPREKESLKAFDVIPVVIAVDLLVEKLRSAKLKIAHAGERDILAARYSLAKTEEKYKMLDLAEAPYIDDDTKAFMEWGPVNTTLTEHPDLYSLTHECRKYGGCRMLLCNEYQTDVWSDIMEDDHGMNSVDWYIGYCITCGTDIEKRHHSLRKPQEGGGWKGCYCSFQCMEDQYDSSITKSMLKETERQIMEYGIRDR